MTLWKEKLTITPMWCWDPACEIGPFPSALSPSSPPPRPRPRPVARRVEKIVFITCQGLAELSYVEQDSIKLSYTSMKLQNRLELNNKIISFWRAAIPFFSPDTSATKLGMEIECEVPGNKDTRNRPQHVNYPCK